MIFVLLVLLPLWIAGALCWMILEAVFLTVQYALAAAAARWNA